jgi:hypothetical protein
VLGLACDEVKKFWPGRQWNWNCTEAATPYAATPVEPPRGCLLNAWGLRETQLFAHLETRIR